MYPSDIVKYDSTFPVHENIGFALRLPTQVQTCVNRMQKSWLNADVADLLMSTNRSKLHMKDRVSNEKTAGGMGTHINSFWSGMLEVVYRYLSLSVS